jgi:hypothetical protein
MYSLAPIKRMIYYGQSETATFNPEDPIGFKAFYDNALKDIPYNRLFTAVHWTARNAPIWPNVAYNRGPGADYRTAYYDVGKSIPKGTSEEQSMLIYYILALITCMYMDAASKITPSNVWKVQIQRYFDSQDVKIFLTYANPNAVINSPFGQGNAEAAIGNLSIASEELLELSGDKYDVVRSIVAFAQLLNQFYNEQKTNPFTDADIYTDLKTAAFNPLDTPTTLPTVEPRAATAAATAPLYPAKEPTDVTQPTFISQATPQIVAAKKPDYKPLLIAAAIGLFIFTRSR